MSVKGFLRKNKSRGWEKGVEVASVRALTWTLSISPPHAMQSFNVLGQCDWHSDPDSSSDDYFVPVKDKGAKRKSRVQTGTSWYTLILCV